MPFKEGHNKGVGRPKGAQNKSTEALRNKIDAILDGHIGTISQLIHQIEKPEVKVRLLIDLLEFALPKLQRVEQSHEIDNDKIESISFTIHHTDSSKEQLKDKSEGEREGEL